MESNQSTQNILPSFANNVIPIVFNCNNNYAPYLAVTMQSIVENGCDKNNYDFFILNDDFTEEGKNKITLQIKGITNSNVRFIDMRVYTQHLDTNIFFIPKHANIAMYYRLFIPSIFANFDKVLYLDSDLVLMNDAAELYNINIKDHILGAVRDVMMKKLCVECSTFADWLNNKIKVKKEKYFNAGVLLLNVKKAIKNNFVQSCIKKLTELKQPILCDQDVLNSLYSEDIYELDMKWNLDLNVINSTKHLRSAVSENVYIDYMTAYDNPSIIHYAGVLSKPWLYSNSSLGHYFWKYAKNTSFYKELQKFNHQLQFKS
jgi:lipopolysaccharide biosynthesis glycosyltransferase